MQLIVSHSPKAPPITTISVSHNIVWTSFEQQVIEVTVHAVGSMIQQIIVNGSSPVSLSMTSEEAEHEGGMLERIGENDEPWSFFIFTSPSSSLQILVQAHYNEVDKLPVYKQLQAALPKNVALFTGGTGALRVLQHFEFSTT